MCSNENANHTSFNIENRFTLKLMYLNKSQIAGSQSSKPAMYRDSDLSFIFASDLPFDVESNFPEEKEKPVFNVKGGVVSVLIATHSGFENVVPVKRVRNFLDGVSRTQVREEGSSQQPAQSSNQFTSFLSACLERMDGAYSQGCLRFTFCEVNIECRRLRRSRTKRRMMKSICPSDKGELESSCQPLTSLLRRTDAASDGPFATMLKSNPGLLVSGNHRFLAGFRRPDSTATHLIFFDRPAEGYGLQCNGFGFRKLRPFEVDDKLQRLDSRALWLMVVSETERVVQVSSRWSQQWMEQPRVIGLPSFRSSFRRFSELTNEWWFPKSSETWFTEKTVSEQHS
ncbi:extra-large GTP-binding protein 2 [Striga asiatica]|uniref:Extra-large GTP-binding protein 2 n=1 Tax=Striga asiatica TaxID=4170 RepID=A0A5A7PWU3_STRAF|nr:extra-large GTP-binding protein 2 [Striga asiatica]